MSEAILFRGLERIFIVLASALFGYLGYRLFLRGISGEKAKIEMKSKLGQLIFSGAAPGLVFMIFGSIVLIYALIYGGAKSTTIGPRGTEQEVSLMSKDVKLLQEQLSQVVTKQDILYQKKEEEYQKLEAILEAYKKVNKIDTEPQAVEEKK